MPLYHVDPGSEAALIKVNDDVDLIKNLGRHHGQ